MNKTKVVLSGIWYPVSIMKYFYYALKAREDIELITVGPFTGRFIPWNGGMNLPEKYSLKPDIALSSHFSSSRGTSPRFLDGHELLEDVGLWIQADSTWFFNEKPKADVVVGIGIDPHVINYDDHRQIADEFYNMQKEYSKQGDIYLPYCASEHFHYPGDIEWDWREYDVALVGLQYENRTELINELKKSGMKVFYGLGYGMDEYREIYHNARVAVSWSSQRDLIARVFEAGAMDIPLVCNMVPDLPSHFVEDEHYLGFGTVSEAVSKVKWLLERPEEAESISYNMNRKVYNQHLYKHRINQILEMCGL
jgi:spore maturation protein CgeB